VTPVVKSTLFEADFAACALSLSTISALYLPLN
jgi:hypothetical protein